MAGISAPGSLTEYERMVWRPPWCLGQHPESLEHDAAWQGIVGSARTWKGAVQVGIHQERVQFSSIRSI